MPLFKKEEITEGVSYAIWKTEEGLDELLGLYNLDESESSELFSFKVKAKQEEWLSARLALKMLLPNQTYTVTKDRFGKPHLDINGLHISISHAKGYGAAAISSKAPLGIDIEHERPQIHRIAHKFLHHSEKVWAADDTSKLTQIWCAKEALYKLHGRTQLIFAEQLTVNRPNNKLEAKGQIIEGSVISDFQLKWVVGHGLLTCIAS